MFTVLKIVGSGLMSIWIPGAGLELFVDRKPALFCKRSYFDIGMYSEWAGA